MYNFLDPKLSPKVSSSAPATDNFEASNLIHENGAIRARGYLAYTVIRPPVDLEFEFLCPIKISFVTLQTSVGRQKCTGIELFAKNSTIPYTSIGKAVFDKSGLIFCDSKTYSKTKPPPGLDSDKELFYFKSDQRRLFSDTTCLKVVIFRTDRSVPCLGAIKVFGSLSRSCSKVTVETVGRIMGGTPKPAPQKQNEVESGLKIPQDFIDDLTCEIMAIPMTLPSGKTVDRDTLEKHLENEKSFGRKPCDPFTGLKFTETRKPNSTNAALFGLKRALGGENFNSDNKRAKYGEKKECCNCQKDQLLYKIPCQHFYCRNCLLTIDELKCNSCGQKFVRSDAVRCH